MLPNRCEIKKSLRSASVFVRTHTYACFLPRELFVILEKEVLGRKCQYKILNAFSFIILIYNLWYFVTMGYTSEAADFNSRHFCADFALYH
jgi:hypothetical protein